MGTVKMHCIVVCGTIRAVHDTAKDALQAAQALSTQESKEVRVYELIGAFQRPGAVALEIAPSLPAQSHHQGEKP